MSQRVFTQIHYKCKTVTVKPRYLSMLQRGFTDKLLSLLKSYVKTPLGRKCNPLIRVIRVSDNLRFKQKKPRKELQGFMPKLLPTPS